MPKWKKTGIRSFYSPSLAAENKIGVCERVNCGFVFLGEENEKIYSPVFEQSLISPETSVASTESGVEIYTAFSGKAESISKIMHPILKTVSAVKIDRPEFSFSLPSAKKDIDAYSPDEIIETAKRFGIVDTDGERLYKKLLQIKSLKPGILVCDAICDTPFESAAAGLLKEYGNIIAKATVTAAYAVGADRSCIAVNGSKNAPQFPQSIDGVPVMKINFRYPTSPVLDMQIRGWGKGGKISAMALFALYNVLVSEKPFPFVCVTVDGTGVNEPKNLFVPIGAPLEDIANLCSLSDFPHQFIIGGIMNGHACLSSTPVPPSATSVIVNDVEKYDTPSKCVYCGECVAVCPKNILPVHIMNAYENRNMSTLRILNPELCISCGCCSYVCPSRINIMKSIKNAKSYVMKGEKK